MKGLNNVTKGVYSLDGFEIQPAEEFAVAVHPFFEGRDRSNRYLKNLYTFLDTFSGPILTLEEYCNLQNTVKKYKKSDNTFNRFFVATEYSTPQPEEIEWKDVKKFIKKFDPKKIKAVGGYYDFSEDGGCLGFTIDTLRKDFKNIEIVEGCTF